jgi:hypothetical protein
MIDILQKTHLKEELNFTLSADLKDFTTYMNEKIDINENNLSRLFAAEKCDYIGQLYTDHFYLQRSKQTFDFIPNYARIKGSICQDADKLLIKAEITPIYGKKKWLSITWIILYLVVGFFPFTSEELLRAMSWHYLIYIMVLSLSVLGFPYVLMRESMKTLNYHFLKDLKKIENLRRN